MTARLLRNEIAHHLAVLQQRSTLTALQSARLAAILDTLADDGRFLLRADCSAVSVDRCCRAARWWTISSRRSRAVTARGTR